MCGVFRNDHHRIPRVWPITVWTHRLVAARFTVCEKLTGALMPVLIGAPVSGHWILINGMGNTLADGLKKFCGGHRQVTSLSLLSPPGPGGGRVRIRPRVRVGAGFAPGPSRVTAGSNGPPTVGSPRKQCSPGHPTNASPHHRDDPTRTTPDVKRSHKLRLPHADRRVEITRSARRPAFPRRGSRRLLGVPSAWTRGQPKAAVLPRATPETPVVTPGDSTRCETVPSNWEPPTKTHPSPWSGSWPPTWLSLGGSLGPHLVATWVSIGESKPAVLPQGAPGTHHRHRSYITTRVKHAEQLNVTSNCCRLLVNSIAWKST